MAEHPTHRSPCKPKNNPLNVNLPNRRTPYSPWTFTIAEHPNHCGPAPPRNTLLTVERPIAEHPTNHGPTPWWNTLLTVDLPCSVTPYSPLTCPTAEHPAQQRSTQPRNTLSLRGPSPSQNTLLTVDLPPCGTPYSLWNSPFAEHPTHLSPDPRGTPYSMDKKCKGRGHQAYIRQTDIAIYRTSSLGADS